MELVEWNESLSVGDVLMDAHHRVFFQMVKELSELNGDTNYEITKNRIDFLVEYTVMHLEAEEKLMSRAGFPDLANHKAVHKAFAAKVMATRDSFTQNSTSVTAESILKLMHDWFLNHIMETDKDYAPYVKKLPLGL